MTKSRIGSIENMLVSVKKDISIYKLAKILLDRDDIDILEMRLKDIIEVARRLPSNKKWVFINAVCTVISIKINEEK